MVTTARAHRLAPASDRFVFGGSLKDETMKRSIIYIIIAILALFIGVVSTWVYQINYPRFQSKSVSGNPLVSVHNFASSDGEEIILYRDITSPAHTHYLFQSNLATQSEVIEQNSKLNEKGQKIGERAVTVSPSGSTRIFWTEGDEFWFIQAPSSELAEEFEASEMFRSARSNNGLHPATN
jgi:hypothetical protein